MLQNAPRLLVHDIAMLDWKLDPEVLVVHLDDDGCQACVVGHQRVEGNIVAPWCANQGTAKGVRFEGNGK